MKIHILSDLHMEFWKQGQKLQDYLRPADVLVLAGDVSVGRANVIHALKEFSEHYKDVIYVPGNHEYYNGIELNAFQDYEKFGSKLPRNVHFLNPGAIHINGVNFIGATLWTNFHENPMAELAAKQGINDFRRIANATPQLMKDMYYNHSQYIKYAYEQREQSCTTIIVTHFLPSMQCVAPRWRLSDYALLNHYFANNMDEWIESLENTTWIHGHTHDAVDVQIGTTRVLANPLGYPSERNFYEHLIYEV